jgi:hypothetical protein
MPSEAVMVPDDATGVTKVVFLFDLSGLRQGDNRHIEEALLDWRVAGVGTDYPALFAAYPVTDAWTKASVEGGTAPATAELMASDWHVSLGTEPAEGRLVRLELTELVGSWASGATANYGVVVSTSALQAKTLATQLANVQLTIRYGFRDDWGSE